MAKATIRVPQLCYVWWDYELAIPSEIADDWDKVEEYIVGLDEGELSEKAEFVGRSDEPLDGDYPNEWGDLVVEEVLPHDPDDAAGE